MVAALPTGSPILADLGYFAFARSDDLTRAGQYWPARLRAKTRYTVLHVCYQSASVWDGIVYLGTYRADRADRADRAAYPVRLVRFTAGSTTWTSVTDVLDPRRLSVRDIATLYARRWDIELAFNLLKTTPGLHLLWSPKPALVGQQPYAVLCLAQTVPALRLELAVRAGIDPFEISLPLLLPLFLPLFLRHVPKLAAAGYADPLAGYADPLAVLVERGAAAGILRPSRHPAPQPAHPHRRP